MNDTIKTYVQPAFLICVTILAVSAAGMSVAIKNFGMYLKKEPLPLKKSLDLLDQNDLTPYKVVVKDRIENKDVLQSLGTEEYIEWVLEDLQAPVDSPVRQCILFVTYYSLPDRVPHVPEECYTGGGYQRQSSEVLTLELEGVSGQNPEGRLSHSEILVKYLVFKATSSGQLGSSNNFPVLYVFNVNGQYTNSREGTRIILNKNIFGKYSYFSKVEWRFLGVKFGQRIFPGKEDSAAASVKFLRVILPILEKEYWPQMTKGREKLTVEN